MTGQEKRIGEHISCGFVLLSPYTVVELCYNTIIDLNALRDEKR